MYENQTKTPKHHAQHLIGTWLPRVGWSEIQSSSGTGAAHVGLDLAAHVASGRPWMGMPVTQLPVTYIASPTDHCISNRLTALDADGQSHEGLTVLHGKCDLRKGLSDENREFFAALAETEPKLTVVSALALLTGGSGGNDLDTTATETLHALRKATSAHIMVCGRSHVTDRERYKREDEAMVYDAMVTNILIKVTDRRGIESTMNAARYAAVAPPDRRGAVSREILQGQPRGTRDFTRRMVEVASYVDGRPIDAGVLDHNRRATAGGA